MFFFTYVCVQRNPMKLIPAALGMGINRRYVNKIKVVPSVHASVVSWCMYIYRTSF